ncbi:MULTISPECIES: ribosome assembly RNA-binding protein YhbY [Anaerosinus]|uniref:Ribosome assembly RNA-binding protein YhbY n=1 Tax=Selenobaculum gibii TaxID=3054208 RepID=A0A9Y2ERP0_9FIRM|nr:ribosome assembly RNA-binding protein YhbY [Selenobaculum gbiensis]WIW71417.1 ribosome assembly RNA-binding protein YhbY [Selenobaculum gbiensis]
MIRNTLTGKQKRFLRAMGSTLDPVVQIGKGGLVPSIVTSALDAIQARELIKVKVLQNCLEDPRAVIETLADRTNTDLVQIIGRNGLLYKKNFEKTKIELPKSK